MNSEPEKTRSLLIVAPAPVIVHGDDIDLDVKFVEGMRTYAEHWKGPISCLLFEGAERIPFGRQYARNELPFSLRVLPKDARIKATDLHGHDIVLGSADSEICFSLPNLCHRENRRCVLAIEYTLATRMDILKLEKRTLPRKVYGGLWLLNAEYRRRIAMRRADGLQANGYPAWMAYENLSDKSMLYFDNRMRKGMLASESQMKSKQDRLMSNAPLRLVYSGRLEKLKGAQDLVTIALELQKSGLPFKLDVFGTGSLENELRNDIGRHGLEESICFHGPVDFETQLVPYVRQHADIFLSCHRQSDPSCTYIESMGCGLAVVGYENEMLAKLVDESGAGWCAPLGQPEKLAARIVAASADRSDVFTRCQKALDFASRHDLDSVFRSRIEHLTSVLL